MKKTLASLKVWRFSFTPLALLLFIVLISSCLPDETDDTDALLSLLGDGYGINSSTIVTQDLDSTLKYYTEVLGFEMPMMEQIEKGVFEGTKSAALPFPDMSMITLLSLEDSVDVKGENSFISEFLKEHEGVRTYSLSSSSVDETHHWLSSQGFKVDSIRSHNKESKFPQEGKWDLGGTQILSVGFGGVEPSAYLPEFVELSSFPYERMHEWSSFYNMQRGFLKHPNGVVGIAALKIVVDDLDAISKDYENMGLNKLDENESKNLARFKLRRNQELHLISPQSPDDKYAKFLSDRGSAVYAITFEVQSLPATFDLLSEKLPKEALQLDSLTNQLTVFRDHAHGVQLEFQQETEEQGLMADELNLAFGSTLDSAARMKAEVMYLKYCALCHGENREGGAADFAPSLRSHSLMATAYSSNFLRYTIQYGRANTAMAGYYKAQGGPMEFIEIELLLKWLYESSGVEEPIELSREPVNGDVELGAVIYAKHCSACHGKDGEGITAPALGNPMLLATATDEFLRYAITEGRDSTLMPAFKDSLSAVEIEATTAFLRSRASGWNVPQGDTVSVPLPENYVLNPDSKGPDFDLREGRYVSAEQLNQALKDSLRLVLLDARSTVAWRQTHIPGALPVPYYEEPEAFLEHIPNDSTMIVVYCACPHAASGQVVDKLNQNGIKNTAILDEGILVWAQLGYPVQFGH